MGHRLAAEAHRRTLSENCMSEDWKDRDEMFGILRKEFILVCFGGNREATPIPINLFQITSCIAQKARSFTQQLNLALISIKILHICDE